MVVNGKTNIVALIAVALLLWVPGVRADEGASIQTIRVPNGGIHPRAGTDDAGRMHLIYVKGDPMRADLFYVRSDDGGKTFSDPLRVNSHPESIVITGTIRGPHLALGKGGRVHVAWMGSGKAEPKGAGKSVPMLYTRLNDAGDGFEPQRNVIQQKPGLDGGGSVAADREGNVYVAWHAPETHHAGGGHGSPQHAPRQDDKRAPQKHQRPAGHGADEADRTVWVTRSRDDGKTFQAETRAITAKTGVCACCGMDIFAGDEGKVVVVFRSAREMVNRDIHVLASDDYGKTFKVALVDPWNVGTCVMSTASMTEAGDGILAAWETRGQIHVARLNPGAAEDKDNKPSAVPGPDTGGKGRKHPSVAANGRGQYVVAWTEGAGWNKGGSLAWQAFDRDGKPIAGQAGRAEGVPAWSVPAVLSTADGFKIVF